MKLPKTLAGAFLFFGAGFFFISCPDPTSGTLNETGKYPRELWGEWIRMDTGAIYRITSNYFSHAASNYKCVKKQSDNVIKLVDEEDRAYYLYASRIPNGTFTGSIVQGDSPRSALKDRALNGFGGIDVSISNLKDRTDQQLTQTDQDGNFTANDIIPGDGYEIIAEDVSVPVYPNTSGENIGTVTVTGGLNFKTSIRPKSKSTDMMSLFAGPEHTYNLEIVVNNTSDIDCTAATYDLALPPGITTTSNTSDIIGTIEPGKERIIDLAIGGGPISVEAEHKNIGIKITNSITKVTWEDSVSLKLNRERAVFTVASDKIISGVIIVPDSKAYHFKTSLSYSEEEEIYYSAEIELPKYYAKDYLIVFSGATADTEAKYAFAVDQTPDTNFDGFTDAGNYEDQNNPNDTEAAAALIEKTQKVMSYLHKNDIDYFKIRF